MATADAFFYSKEEDWNYEDDSNLSSKNSPRKSQLSTTSLAGDYTVRFDQKPLKLKLAISKQNYGTWEIGVNKNLDHPEIQLGDVLLAINHNRSLASLPSAEFVTLIESLTCPIELTFRCPSFYFHTESLSIAMAMYPNTPSILSPSSYKPVWKTRASSDQWKCALADDLTINGINQLEFQPELNIYGDYSICIPKSITFPFTFGSSTRLYGSLVIATIEIEEYKNQTHIGDVILAINGNEKAATWDLIELQTYITEYYQKENELILTLRYPKMYQTYLKSLFQQKKTAEKPLEKTSSVYALTIASCEKQKTTPTSSPSSAATETKELIIEELQKFKKQKLDVNAKFCYYQTKNYTSILMTKYFYQRIKENLPLAYRYNNLKCAYATPIHGWSMMIFYELLRSYNAPSITLIKDMDENIFGIFASKPWILSNKSYGDGNTFLFSLLPKLQFYKWTNTNFHDIFLLGKKDAIIVGGGHHSFALCLQLDAECGFTEMSTVFNNPDFTGTGKSTFQCIAVETWVLQGLQI